MAWPDDRGGSDAAGKRWGTARRAERRNAGNCRPSVPAGSSTRPTWPMRPGHGQRDPASPAHLSERLYPAWKIIVLDKY